MAEFVFGKTSRGHLHTCDSRLIAVMSRALSYGVMDFAITCGHRTLEAQQAAFHAGTTELDGITNKSLHQTSPSEAIDVVPYIGGKAVWDPFPFTILAGIIFVAAADEGVELIWGGDWNHNWSNKDQKFHDLPHFQLR